MQLPVLQGFRCPLMGDGRLSRPGVVNVGARYESRSSVISLNVTFSNIFACKGGYLDMITICDQALKDWPKKDRHECKSEQSGCFKAQAQRD